jgi:hypothetical protein
MKQLLLLAVIHLLIFHQYKKDKGEALAPKNNKSLKRDALLRTDVLLPVVKPDYLFRSIANNINDSLLSLHPGTLSSNYVNYTSLSVQAPGNK